IEPLNTGGGDAVRDSPYPRIGIAMMTGSPPPASPPTSAVITIGGDRPRALPQRRGLTGDRPAGHRARAAHCARPPVAAFHRCRNTEVRRAPRAFLSPSGRPPRGSVPSGEDENTHASPACKT